MALQNPNRADVYKQAEAFPFLAGKVNNLNADVYLYGETLRSLEPTASTLQTRLLLGVGL